MRRRLSMTPRQLREWCNAESMLKEITLAAVKIWPIPTCEMTSMRRKPSENKRAGAKTTIHVTARGGKHRAADLRTKTFKDQAIQTELICHIINEQYTYDPARPKLKVAIGKTHGSGPHIHLQVHPNTIPKRSAQENGIWE